MQNAFYDFCRSLTNFKTVSGKFSSIQFESELKYIKRIGHWDSGKKNLPFVIFQTANESFLGIVLARQSSDFLAGLAKRVLSKLDCEGNESNEKSKSVLLQYMFPKEFASTKLIVLVKWINRFDFQAFTQKLLSIQQLFLQKMQELLD